MVEKGHKDVANSINKILETVKRFEDKKRKNLKSICDKKLGYSMVKDVVINRTSEGLV